MIYSFKKNLNDRVGKLKLIVEPPLLSIILSVSVSVKFVKVCL